MHAIFTLSPPFCFHTLYTPLAKENKDIRYERESKREKKEVAKQEA